VIAADAGVPRRAIRFNESELSARFPNGSVIYLVGADSNEDERQKRFSGR